MIKDRLLEFQQKRNIIAKDYNPVDTEFDFLRLLDQDPNFGNVFDHISELRSRINQMKNDFERIIQIQGQLLCTPHFNKGLQLEMNELILKVTNDYKTLNLQMSDFKVEATEDVQENMPLLIRIHGIHYSALQHEFTEALNQYYNAQVIYRNACKSQIQRQLEIANTEYSEEKVEEMIDQGNVCGFAENLLLDTSHNQQILSDVVARQNSIHKLEQSVREVHEMFCEMAILVENQQDKVSSIQDEVNRVQERMKPTVVIFQENSRWQQMRRKKRIVLAIVGTFIFLMMCLSIVMKWN